jgi:RimJ/RimL family protein N-acetyltransferase
MNQLIIKKTTKEDLENVMKLWNDGDVMVYVGFPEGLNVTIEKLERWLISIDQTEHREHYSIYEKSLGYCGETYYHVDEHGYAALDIKLLKHARSRNIAYEALKFAINEAFKHGHARFVYVDPHQDNQKAWALYQKLGFKQAKKPLHLNVADTYQQICDHEWLL